MKFLTDKTYLKFKKCKKKNNATVKYCNARTSYCPVPTVQSVQSTRIVVHSFVACDVRSGDAVSGFNVRVHDSAAQYVHRRSSKYGTGFSVALYLSLNDNTKRILVVIVRVNSGFVYNKGGLIVARCYELTWLSPYPERKTMLLRYEKYVLKIILFFTIYKILSGNLILFEFLIFK